MRGETRTKKQIEADRLDLEVFRLVDRLQQFADEFKDSDVRATAQSLSACRRHVRKHMSAKDRERTEDR